MRIAAIGRAFPGHYYDQQTLLDALRAHWGVRYHNLDRLEQLHRHARVGGRHLALPLAEYATLSGFGAANDAWLRVGLEVAAAATSEALAAAGLGVGAIGSLLFTTVTGVAAPSLDARLANRLGLRSDLRRLPLFGLGCVAGAAGLARAADLVRAWPEEAALVLSVELCSLTLQRDDLSMPNLIASGLFGDGAAAAVVLGPRHPLAASASGPRILASRAVFYPDTEAVMGWKVGESGLRIVLSAEVPKVVREHLATDVDAFLADCGLARHRITSWVSHPGGPKVLEAVEQALELPAEALELSWRSLAEVGNLSSTSVLLVLGDTMAERRPPPGSLGLLFAFGPGFCSELLLLEW
jgi:alkylresorcinol/alkylpyrone synthase